jgi:hypothetical protein
LERQACIAPLLSIQGHRTAARVEDPQVALQGATAGLRADGNVDHVTRVEMDLVEIEGVGRGEVRGDVGGAEGGEGQRRRRQGEDDAIL